MNNLQFIHLILCSAAGGSLFGGGIILVIATSTANGRGIGIFMTILGIALWIYTMRYRKELYKE